MFSQVQSFFGDVVDYGADLYHSAVDTNYAKSKQEILKSSQFVQNAAIIAAVSTFAIALFATFASSLTLGLLAVTGAVITYDLAQLSKNLRKISQNPASYLNARGLVSSDSVNFERLKNVIGANMIFGSLYTTWALNQMELKQSK